MELVHSTQGGRPSKYSAELAEELCCEWLTSTNINSALAHFSIHRSTVWRWKSEKPEFQAMWARAEHVRKTILSERRKPMRQQRAVVQQISKSFIAPDCETLRTRGRPTKYRRNYCESAVGSLSEISKAIRVSRRTVAYWCRRHSEFGKRHKLEYAARKSSALWTWVMERGCMLFEDR